MSKTKIRSGGAWVDPANVYVRQSGSWTSVNTVNVRKSGAWQEVWPNAADNITAGFAIITIDVDDTKYPDLRWELRAMNPGYMVQPKLYGGSFVQDLDINNNSVLFHRTTNPRGIWRPEAPISVAPYITLLGRSEINSFIYSSTHTGIYNNSLLLDERLGIAADTPTISEMQSGYNQIALYYNNMVSEFVTNGHFDFDENGLGEVFRFSLQCVWPADWSYNPASYPITFTIDFYQGGSIVRDANTGVYSGSGHTQKLTYTRTYTAEKYTDNRPYYGLPHDYSAFYMDYDFVAHEVSIGTLTPPPNIIDEAGVFEIRCTAAEPYLKPVFWISDPLSNPSTGNGCPALDAPVYDTDLTTVLRYDIYPLRTPANGGTEVANSSSGMASVASETLQQYGRYSDYAGETYPFRPSTGISTRWWLVGDFYSATVGEIQYAYFDPIQYHFDNPDVSSVTLKLQAWYPSGYGPATETFYVYYWPEAVKGIDAAHTTEGANGITIGSFTKSITSTGTDNDPHFGTDIGTITFTYSGPNLVVSMTAA